MHIRKLKILNIGALAIICVFTVSVYLNSLHGEFQFDDFGFIVNNTSLFDIKDLKSIWKAEKIPSRFITFYTFALNYHFHKLDTFGYHLTNLLIHLFATFFIWCFVRLTLKKEISQSELLEQNRDLIALFVALIFAVHPIQTQAVSYISQRFASLATMFYFCSFSLYVYARLLNKGNKQFFFMMGSILAGILGMFSKEIVFTLPFAILLYEVYFFQGEESLLKTIKNKWYSFLGAFLLIPILPVLFRLDFRRIFSIPYQSHSYEGEVFYSSQYLLTQFRVIIIYLKLLFFPIGQNLDYHFRISRSFFEPTTFLSFILLISVIIFAIVIRKRHQVISFGIMLFFLLLSVESSIIPIRNVIFEHRLYLPMVGFSMAFVVGMLSLMRDWRKCCVVLSLVVVFLSMLTIQRNKVWSSGMNLWQDVLSKSPHKARPHFNLGVQYYNLKNYQDSLRFYDQALLINPQYAEAYRGRGLVLFDLKRPEEAVAEYTKAIFYRPGFVDAFYDRAVAYHVRGDTQKALADYNQAIDIMPRYYKAFNNRGALYFDQMKEFVLAEQDFNQAIKLHPEYAEAYNNKGLMYQRQSRFDFALLAYNDAVRINPDFVQAYYNKGLAYLNAQKFSEAIRAFDLALMKNPNYFWAYMDRGLAHQLNGNFKDAIGDYSIILQKEPKNTLAYARRAVSYHRLRKFDLALNDYNAWLSIDPQNASAYLSRSIVYKAMNQYAKALTDAQAAQSLGQEVDKAYINDLMLLLSSVPFEVSP